MRKLLVILALLVMSLSVASAQEVNCGTLSDSDCALLQASADASASLTSATFDFIVNIGTPEGALGLSGNGSFGGDFSGFDANAIAGITDPALLIEALKPFIAGANAELNLGISAPEQGIPEGLFAFNLSLVDGIGYFNFGALAMLMGGEQGLTAAGLPAGWGGLDLIDTLDNLAAFAGGMAPEGVDSASPEMSDEVTQMVMNYAVIEAVAGDGETTFVTTIDFAGLVQDPAFMEMVIAQASSQGEDISPEALAEAAPMIAALGEAVKMSFSQVVDNASAVTTSVSFEIVLNADVLAAVTGDSSMSGSISIDGVINLADHNNAPAVVAPAGAPIAKFMDLMGMMSGGGGF